MERFTIRNRKQLQTNFEIAILKGATGIVHTMTVFVINNGRQTTCIIVRSEYSHLQCFDPDITWWLLYWLACSNRVNYLAPFHVFYLVLHCNLIGWGMKKINFGVYFVFFLFANDVDGRSLSPVLFNSPSLLIPK